MDQEDGQAALTRRTAIAGLTLASVGAFLAACRVGSPSNTGESISPATTSPVSTALSAASSAPSTPTRGVENTITLAPTTLSERQRFGHLMRRAGFGASSAELDRWIALGWPGAVNTLVDYESISNQPLEDYLSSLNLDLTKAADIQRWWLIRMIGTTRPLEEKMTLFWHGLLTSALTSAKPPLMLAQNRFLRTHALDDYGTILKGITRDPAMMRWLNTIENRKGQANENYARELMELFTLGPGNYTETDVRESARAFTGLVVRQATGATVLVPSLHDDGVKIFLGETGNFGPDDIIDIILRQPAAAPFLATRLLRFFVTQNPAQESVSTIATVLTRTNFSVKEALRALLNLPDFQNPANYRGLIKSPAEYLSSTIRTIGARTDARLFPYAMVPMGQILFDPPNVAGWPGGAAWLNSGTWLARLNVANALTSNQSLVQFDASSLLGAQSAGSPQQFVDRLVELLLDGDLEDDQRQILHDFASQDGSPSISRTWLDTRGRAVLYLILCLPEYHLN